MTKRQMHFGITAAISSTLFISLAFAVMYARDRTAHNSINQTMVLADYSMVEKNFTSDIAVISVRTNTRYTNKMRLITKHIVESQVKESHSKATIFFYPEDANYRTDEPMHKFTWKKNRGFSMQY